MFIKLEDATSLVFADGLMRVSNEYEFLAWQAEKLAARGIARVTNSLLMLKARVCHGRWMVDCPCGAGVFTHPVWRIACCAHCGAVYRAVLFPLNIDAIVKILLERPSQENQNWFPHEDPEVLALENTLYLESC